MQLRRVFIQHIRPVTPSCCVRPVIVAFFVRKIYVYTHTYERKYKRQL